MKLEKEAMKEIKQLVKRLEEKVKELEENNTATDKFTIGNKTYAVNSLDNEGEKIISQISDIVY